MDMGASDAHGAFMAHVALSALAVVCIVTAAGVARHEDPIFAALTVPPLVFSAAVIVLVLITSACAQ